MPKILIVDDEHIEREGIKLLIHKYKLPLSVLEAENGEEALDILASHPIDILFTDIKMPFMDGLELCRRARERFPELKIIIFSVIELCQKDQELEKEHLLLELINNGQQNAGLTQKLALSGIDFNLMSIQMILIDFTQPVFDVEHDELPDRVKQVISAPVEYVNLNENQSFLFVLYDRNSWNGEEQQPLGSKLKDSITGLYDDTVTFVVGRHVFTESELAQEFRLMESVLENAKDYMQIQSIMHNYNFDFSCEVEEALLRYDMINLIFQPILENALEHGIDKLRKGSDRGRIVLRGYMVGEDLEFSIEDNGPGMSRELAEEVLRMNTTGYGLKNVHDRIQIRFGQGYGLRIHSELGKGTKIYLTFPSIWRERLRLSL